MSARDHEMTSVDSLKPAKDELVADGKVKLAEKRKK